MNKDQGTGIIERFSYGLVLAVAMKFVAWGWLSADMAPYVAGGVVGAAGAAYAWWINRPVALMNSAADQLPRNTMLVVTPTPNASSLDRAEANALAEASSAKVIAKT